VVNATIATSRSIIKIICLTVFYYYEFLCCWELLLIENKYDIKIRARTHNSNGVKKILDAHYVMLVCDKLI